MLTAGWCIDPRTGLRGRYAKRFRSGNVCYSNAPDGRGAPRFVPGTGDRRLLAILRPGATSNDRCNIKRPVHGLPHGLSILEPLANALNSVSESWCALVTDRSTFVGAPRQPLPITAKPTSNFEISTIFDSDATGR